jgi:hypothetical protein
MSRAKKAEVMRAACFMSPDRIPVPSSELGLEKTCLTKNENATFILMRLILVLVLLCLVAPT